MKAASWPVAGLGLWILVALSAAASAGQPYEGFWASTPRDCRNQDSASRLRIDGANRFDWYETRCRADEVKADGDRAWRMRLSCEGEGEKFKSRSRFSIATDGKLVIDNGPVGRAKRQTYLRCDTPKKR